MEAIDEEAKRHQVLPNEFKLNVPRKIFSAHETGYEQQAKCMCGHTFSVITQYDAKTQVGQMELVNLLPPEAAKHLLQAIAEIVYHLHDVPS
jgi:hypothetical protein